jgi:cytochrome c biogenesis protein CcmG, thiol:disulfide interchange protein DsbE
MRHFRSWHLFLLLGLSGLIFLFYQGLWGDPTSLPPVIIEEPAPDFTALELYEKKEVNLSDHLGKVVVLNFWASWCQECKLEHKFLLALKKHFEDNPDFVMYGVNYQDKDRLAKAYLKLHGNNFDHVVDVKGKISIDYGVYGVPETFVIDKNGTIRHKHIGPIMGDVYSDIIKNNIEPLLSERTTSS